jgi:hypothetical protein
MRSMARLHSINQRVRLNVPLHYNMYPTQQQPLEIALPFFASRMSTPCDQDTGSG